MSVMGAAGIELQEEEELQELQKEKKVSNRHLTQLLCRCQATPSAPCSSITFPNPPPSAATPVTRRPK